MIQREDVVQIADVLKITLTEEEIQTVIDDYNEDDDSCSSWGEIIESIIYRIKS